MLNAKNVARKLMGASVRNLLRVSAKKDPESPTGYYDLVMDRHQKRMQSKDWSIYTELVWFNREVYGYEFDKAITLLKEFATALIIALIVAAIIKV